MNNPKRKECPECNADMILWDITHDKIKVGQVCECGYREDVEL